MKSIRLMTFHTPKNYGAVLQAFSLMNYLKKYSDDVKVIDYNTKHLRSIYPVIKKSTSIKGLIKNILLLPTYFSVCKKHKKFDDFVNHKMQLTSRFEKTDELYKYNWSNEIFVTGSDQVFNPGRIADERKAFYLDFVPSSNKKISYAGSFGCENIDSTKANEIKAYLNKFDAISVRENSAIGIVENLINTTPQLVLDPVFLNDTNFWINNAKAYKKVKGKYLLYYRLMGNKKCDTSVYNIAKQLGVNVVVITESLCTRPFKKVLYDVGPEEFLGLYKNASFVATDSFHGIAFSVIFKKQFAFLDTDTKTNDRGLNLLEVFGIKDKSYIENFSPYNLIDYNYVQNKLDCILRDCFNYLEQNCS